MRRLLKVAVIVLASLLTLVAVAVIALLGYRSYLQHRNAAALAIRTPHGIDEGMYVRIGGIDQWVQIRGRDRRNPAILCLNGGPGASWVPLTPLFVGWEKDFTVVQWDQRGEGKTLETTGPSIAATMSVDRMAQDGIEVAQFLRDHLHQHTIVLLGHSWGSILGIHMIKARPDLFSAYVGTGQVGNLPRSLALTYADTLAKARAANDAAAVTDLQRIGPPPYDAAHIGNVGVLFKWLGAYAPESDRAILSSLGPMLLAAPNYSLRDFYYRNLSFTTVPMPKLYDEMLSTNLFRLGPNFEVPVYFIQGAQDDITIPSQAKEYFESLRAPKKAFVLLPGGGHTAVWSMPDRFLRELVRLGV